MSMYEDITGLLSGGSALESLSGFIGEDQATTGNAVSAAVPALMGGLSKRTSTADGASALFKMVQGNDGSILDNIGGFLGSDDGGMGAGLVGSILGGRSNAVTQAVADRSGLGIGGVAKLLPAVAPMIMGFLGRKQSAEGLDQAGLMSQIAGESTAMQAGGLGGLLSAFDGGDDDADNAGFLSGLGKFAGLGGVAAAGAAGAAAMSGKAGDAVSGITGKAGDAVSGVTGKAGDAASGVTGAVKGGAGKAAAGAAAVGGVAAAASSRANVDKPAGWVEREADTQKVAGGTTTRREVQYDEPNKKKGMWWLWPLLGLIALAILIPLLLTQCGGDDDNDVETDTAPVATTEAMEEEVVETTPPTTEAMEEEAPPATEAPVATRFAPGRILDTADQAGDFGVLLSAVEGAGLVDTLDGDGPFTVFAPTDEAFADVPESISGDPDLLAQVLAYHVVPGNVTSADLADGPVTTVEGTDITIATDGPTVNGVSIVEADITADNGVVHVIDQVLVPASIRAQAGESLNSVLDLEPINFEVGSAVITAEGQAVLDGAVEFLTANPIPVSIEGHTDSDGSDAANLTLSQARAESVLAYLVENGVDASLLSAKGFGEGSPIADNATDEGKAENRRIEFVTAS